MEPFEQAEAALALLWAVADARPAVDASGAIVAPLPGAHRAMASPACLPHLVQVGAAWALRLPCPNSSVHENADRMVPKIGNMPYL